MTEAWMKRGGERQEFLKRIKGWLADEAEQSHKRLTVQLRMVIAFSQFFAEQENFSLGIDTGRYGTFFREKVLSAIQEFARTPEEAVSLVAELFEWECASIARGFKAGLQTQEVMQPELVFDGRGAMDEVPL